MGFRLDEAEQLEFLARGHTATVTTLKRDGWPVTLPVWYALVEGVVYVATPPHAVKLKRLRNDDRVWFLVETGHKWVDLVAVGFPARGVILEPGPEAEAAMTAFDAKYAEFRPPADRLPPAVAAAYSDQVVIRLEQTGRALTWRNAAIPLLDHAGVNGG